VLADSTLEHSTFDIARAEDATLMFNPTTPEGRRETLKSVVAEASIEVTNALLMADELDAFPVADDTTYPRLLALRSSTGEYSKGSRSLAPLLGMEFGRAVIPDEVLQKIEFGAIFEYRAKSKDVYDA
jgi:hypothetical protein